MYRLPNKWLILMLIILRMRFEQIAFCSLENSTTRITREYRNHIYLCEVILKVMLVTCDLRRIGSLICNPGFQYSANH